MNQCSLDVILPVELTNGNDGRGHKFFRSANVRKKIEVILRTAGFVRTPFDYPVVVIVTRILGKNQRLWDSSSVGRGNWKEIEDSLVSLGWFHDDAPKWITETRFRQDASQRERGPVVRVQVIRERNQ